jgi:hypothetical protein
MSPEPRAPRRAGGRLFAPRVLLFAVMVPLLLYRRIDRLAPLLEPARTPPPPPREEVDALVARIDRLLPAGRPFVRSGCLTRGLTLYYFLRRAGAPVALCFGAGPVDGDFSGHCWVVYQGEPLAEKRDPRPLFAEMLRIPGASEESGT